MHFLLKDSLESLLNKKRDRVVCLKGQELNFRSNVLYYTHIC